MKKRTITRRTHEIIFIFCEGEKTEIKYFTRYKNLLKTYGIELKPTSPECTHPKGIVEDAIECLEEEKPDHVWCVFDRDANTQRQLDEAKQLADKHEIRIAYSNPCFEIWFLLHFQYTSRPFENYEKLEQEIRKVPELAQYRKKDCIFEIVYPRQEAAVKHAKQLIAEHTKIGNIPQYSVESNPSTSVHELVKFLEAKKRP